METSAANGMDEKAMSLSTRSIVDDGQKQVVEVTDEKNRLTRHPRWTKLETLVLVEGKKIAENQGRRKPGLLLGTTGETESKWDGISSYCKKHGINRGPVQCRKRWSNLICDFKKIKMWESRQNEEEECESYWMMRSDVRRNMKLPGFFDREVYSVLDGKATRVMESPIVIPIMTAYGKENGGTEVSETENEDDGEAEEIRDGGNHDKGNQTPVSGSEGLEEPEELHRTSEEDNATRIPAETISTAVPISGKQPCMHWRRSIFQGAKRQRFSSDVCESMNLNHKLIKAMEKNTLILNAQLDTQNMNSQLERDQQKGQSDKLVSALSKISDALSRIADKL